MELSQEVKDKILKSAESIYNKGRNDEKTAKKNLSESGKEVLRIADSIVKRVDAGKNVPTDKSFKKKLTGNLEEITRNSLLTLASDAITLALTMPKPEKKPKEPKPA
ncbi:MAG: hypothetical protein K5790_10395 [Nitrosopumilus sp.]|uniref:hypothetical protein n=1 Tax=Nitrosopumilus sp. TaxID=2024843 RepID=UPI00247D078A|nr:hypothetical protein [Nitrosopumilus sp.]MCV0393679.1 hypothetical protein [Nitrosopumilus sp.]